MRRLTKPLQNLPLLHELNEGRKLEELIRLMAGNIIA